MLADELRPQNPAHAFEGIEIIVVPVFALGISLDAEARGQPGQAPLDAHIGAGIALPEVEAVDRQRADPRAGHAAVRRTGRVAPAPVLLVLPFPVRGQALRPHVAGQPEVAARRRVHAEQRELGTGIVAILARLPRGHARHILARGAGAVERPPARDAQRLRLLFQLAENLLRDLGAVTPGPLRALRLEEVPRGRAQLGQEGRVAVRLDQHGEHAVLVAAESLDGPRRRDAPANRRVDRWILVVRARVNEGQGQGKILVFGTDGRLPVLHVLQGELPQKRAAAVDGAVHVLGPEAHALEAARRPVAARANARGFPRVDLRRRRRRGRRRRCLRRSRRLLGRSRRLRSLRLASRRGSRGDFGRRRRCLRRSRRLLRRGRRLRSLLLASRRWSRGAFLGRRGRRLRLNGQQRDDLRFRHPGVHQPRRALRRGDAEDDLERPRLAGGNPYERARPARTALGHGVGRGLRAIGRRVRELLGRLEELAALAGVPHRHVEHEEPIAPGILAGEARRHGLPRD